MGDPLESWEAQLRTYDLPEWDNLPELELYMDQVVLLLSRYLAFFSQGEEEKIITPSIVNNYVRMKVMPAPAKKRYGRIHIAYLLMICTLKQSLSIAAIQKLLPLELDEAQVRALYTRFVAVYRAVAGHFFQLLQAVQSVLCMHRLGHTSSCQHPRTTQIDSREKLPKHVLILLCRKK